MDHHDHVNLLRAGIPGPGGVWAELGSGHGAFTLALADLLGPGAHIYSIDHDRDALRAQERAVHVRFPHAHVDYLHADYTQPLDLPPLDGLLMANSLHFQRDKDPVLQRVRGYLKPGGRFLLVEYNTDHGNAWVPYPLSYGTFEKLAKQNGFTGVRKIGAVPSSFLGEIYSALSLAP